MAVRKQLEVVAGILRHQHNQDRYSRPGNPNRDRNPNSRQQLASRHPSRPSPNPSQASPSRPSPSQASQNRQRL